MRCRALMLAVGVGAMTMMTRVDASLTAQVRRTAAGPALYVNGKLTAPNILFVNLYDVADPIHTPLQLGEIEAAGRHGVNLVSITLGTPWPLPGETPDYDARADRWIALVLKANPKALIIPRILMTAPPDSWFAHHPGERMLYDNGERGIPSVHSACWRRDAEAALGALVEHLEARFGDHILGYHPSGQHTGEWFYDRMWEGRTASYEPTTVVAFRRFLKAKYGADSSLQRAWQLPNVAIEYANLPNAAERRASAHPAFRDPVLQRRAIDFDEFLNVEMADALAGLCRAIKRHAPHKLSLVFYGYPFEMAPAPAGMQTSGHLALRRLLKCPDLDVLCSPVSYFDRGLGGGGYFMAPVDSVQLHGKLWLVEDDTRTHLSSPESGYGRPADFRGSQGILARNFAHYATRGAAAWWMDLPGEGWFAGEEIWGYLAQLHGAYASALPTRTPYRPEIAVILDEQSPLFGSPDAALNTPLLYRFRAQLYRIGAPIGLYLLDDLVEGRTPPARLTIVLNAFRLSERQLRAIRLRTAGQGRATLWMTAPGIIRDDRYDPALVSETVGLSVRPRGVRACGIVDMAGVAWPADDAPAAFVPAFEIDDPATEALARYADGGATAVGACASADGLTVYCAPPSMPAALLREIARRAGVRLFSEQGDVVMAGGGWLALHATAPGPRTLTVPHGSRWRDALTAELLPAVDRLTFEMALGDTKLLRQEPARP